ncbi:uncharacterized protein K452DRAFT_294103 [Aplosporella prunicola CBS 121167]|uniref:Ubiquitin-conjugating enzyme E2 2 n=1 Tax=Aplosporella prunicola CBS 121167 TaxID=1176127 RepID=A0A6A6BR02_9PEZI|nr:uncharacterized protein K452DRAFT_294103 [Aplosporella prunicola CBS 121167]KAF2146539.1 hypothetical protein K452DRAFT_294103 [Aplosporella prunicola CBS 121167]
MLASKRLAKELAKIHEGLPPGIDLVKADDWDEWLMDIRVVDDNPIYRGETYRLKFKFSNNYPIEAPEVTFTTAPPTVATIPLHPHIYSNGIICLDLLDRAGWSPVHNVQSVCVSIQSMLTGNVVAERPPGDSDFVKRNTQRPKDIRFAFHDDTV